MFWFCRKKSAQRDGLIISRRDAKLAKAGCEFIFYTSSYVFLCSYVVYFSQRRKVRKGCGFSVFILDVLSAALSQRLGVLIDASPFAFLLFLLWWKMHVLFLAETQGSLRLDLFCVYSLCFEASLSQRTMCVNLRFALCVLMCPYVVNVCYTVLLLATCYLIPAS